MSMSFPDPNVMEMLTNAQTRFQPFHLLGNALGRLPGLRLPLHLLTHGQEGFPKPRRILL